MIGFDARQINLSALRAAAIVAVHGSFLRAGTHLGISQSQVSRQIAALEAYIGQSLFHRHGRGIALTEFGKLILPRIQFLISELDALQVMAREAGAQLSGDVSVGIVPLASRHMAANLMRRIQTLHPGIRLRLLEAYSGQVEEWLGSGRIDIGVFNRYGRSRPVGADLLMRGHVSIIGIPGHPALRQQDASFESLARIPLAMPVRPNSLTDHVLTVASARRIPLNIVFEAGSSALVREAMLSSGLLTLSPAGTYKDAIAAHQLVARRLRSPAIAQSTWVATSTQHPVSRAMRAVEDVIKKIVDTGPQ